MNKNLRNKPLLKLMLGCAVSLLLTSWTHAKEQSSEEVGLAIAKKMKESTIGWGTSESKMIMRVRDESENELVFHVRSLAKEVEGDGDKTLLIFEQPEDIKGTKFLSISHIEGGDEQWLFLPAVNRVKKIESGIRSGPFLGSEVSYEDLASFEVAKNTYKHLGDKTVDGVVFSLVEMRPVDQDSGYSKMVDWIDNKTYRSRKSEVYDREDIRLKTMVATDFQLHLGKYWRASKISMKNHQTGRSTDIEITDLAFGIELDDDIFSEHEFKNVNN